MHKWIIVMGIIWEPHFDLMDITTASLRRRLNVVQGSAKIEANSHRTIYRLLPPHR
jgi:hypothetical protein